MGDGWVHRGSKRPAFKVATTEKEYINYLYGELSPLSCSINEYQDGLYTMTTHSLCCLEEFSSWYDSGEKVFPENISLTPTILRNWYACDGSLVRGRYINIGVSNERERLGNITSLFRDVGLPEPRTNTWGDSEAQLVWKVSESEKLLSYMDGSVPGYEYKWERVKYDADQ